MPRPYAEVKFLELPSRAHKAIYDRVGPTLAHAKLPSKFWPEIARTAAFLSNRSPSSKLKMTPYQAWYGESPIYHDFE